MLPAKPYPSRQPRLPMPTDAFLPPADPAFRKPLHATYTFERLQPMQLVVYDVDVKVGVLVIS